MPTLRQLSTRSILLILVILNFLGIALSEVQRRALITYATEFQRNERQHISSQLKSLIERQAQLEAAQERETRVLIWHDAKLDRAAMLFSDTNGRANRLESLAGVRQRDALRADHVKILRIALDVYHAAKGVFPGPFEDNPTEDLNKLLVGGGYLPAIPHDPLPARSYRYTTAGAAEGQRYGLKVSLENGGDCVTGVGTEGSGWWPTLPACPF